MKIVLTVRSSAPSTETYSRAIETIFYVAQSSRVDTSCNISDELSKTLFMQTYNFVTCIPTQTHTIHCIL